MRFIVTAFLATCLLWMIPGVVRAQDPGDAIEESRASEVEELVLEARYAHTVNRYVAARYYEGQVYLSFPELFRALSIAVRVDSARSVISGFIFDQENTYRIDFGAHRFQNGKRKLTIPEEGILMVDGDYFVRPELLEAWFELNGTVDLARFTYEVRPRRALPPLLAIQRARKTITPLYFSTEYHPLLYPRRQALLSLGVLDYSLSLNTTRDARTLGGSYRLGASVLGGDLSWRASLGKGPDPTDISWRYVVSPEKRGALTTVELGHFQSVGTNVVSLSGVRFSNKHYEPRRAFSQRTITGTVEPRWEVEILADGRLVGRTKADESGRYSYVVPVGYGVSIITARAFGPTGEVQEDRDIHYVLPMMLPARETEYTLGAGVCEYGCQEAGQASLTTGLTDRLTASVQVGAYRVADSMLTLPAVTFSSRPFSNTTLSVSLSPGRAFRSELWSYFGTGSYLRLFAGDRINRMQYTLTNTTREGGASVGLPFGLASIKGSLSADVDLRWTPAGRSDQRRLYTEWYLGDVTARLGYRESAYTYDASTFRDQLLMPAVRFMLPSNSLILRNVSVNAGLDYSLTDFVRSRTTWSMEVSKAMRNGSSIRMYYRNGGVSGRLFTFALSYNLPWARASVRGSAGARGRSTVQSVSGSLGLDASRLRLVPSFRSAVGKSAVTMRFFLDENANARLDRGETLVPGLQPRVQQGFAPIQVDSSIVQFRNLVPYRRYNVHLADGDIPNPLWIPRARDFSFQTEPNTYRVIDVPIFVSGTVEGQVGANFEAATLAGIKISLKQLEGGQEITLTTFADGSFYHIQIPPGRYRASLDAAQLQSLGLSTNELTREFEIKPSADGDEVSGIAFVLDQIGRKMH